MADGHRSEVWVKKASGSDLKATIDAYYGERAIFVPKASYTLTNPIVIDDLRGVIEANWATIIPPSGQFALEVHGGYSYTAHNPNGIIRNVIIDGNSRAGSGIKVKDHQGFKAENLILTGCDEGIQITCDTANQFSEGNAFDHAHILNPNIGVNFKSGGGSNSFMDTKLKDFRVNLSIADSIALNYDVTTSHCKPHTSIYESWHIWYKAANTIGVNIPDLVSGHLTQLWHSTFRNWMHECYDDSGTAIGMKFGTSLDAAQKIHFDPMPYFIVNGGTWGKRISNPNNKCIGDGYGCLNDQGFVMWTADGTKIYRVYVTNAGVITAQDITTSYDNT